MQPNYDLALPPRSIVVLPREPRLIRGILFMAVDGILRISIDEVLFDSCLLGQGVHIYLLHNPARIFYLVGDKLGTMTLRLTMHIDTPLEYEDQIWQPENHEASVD